MSTENSQIHLRASEPSAPPMWVSRAAMVAGAIMAFGSAWQISDGLARQPHSTAVQVQANGGTPSDATTALRSAINEMQRELERARRLLEQTGA